MRYLSRCRRHVRWLTLAAVLAFPTDAPASHSSPGTLLWGYTAALGNSPIYSYDIGTDTLISSCVPVNQNGRGIAMDPVDGNLWYTGPASGGMIHKVTTSCVPAGSIPSGLGTALIGALDADPDDGNLWVAMYFAVGPDLTIAKLDRVTGAILASCTTPFVGQPGGNDTLAVAQLSGLPGSGKYLLTDAGEFNPTLQVIDAATCTGGGPGAIVTTFLLPFGPTGIDYENGQLIASDISDPNMIVNSIVNLGGPPFSTVLDSMPASFPMGGVLIEDLTLVPRMNPTPTATATTTAPTPTATATPTPTSTPPLLDHFTCYKATVPNGPGTFPGISNPPGVSLVDQFGTAQVRVKKAKFLCAPTNKNGEDPSAPTHPEHLKAYPIKHGVRPELPNLMKIVDQFNPTGLFVKAKDPSHLLVPSTKSLSTTPPTPAAFVTDHFECYRVAVPGGHPHFVPVTNVIVQDQFGTMHVDVKKPTYLCAPVDKNGEDPSAPSHAAHLMCYRAAQISVPPFANVVGVSVNNQFGPETSTVKKPGELCVPASKTIIP